MNILIIEDDDLKFGLLSQLVSDLSLSVDLNRAGSYQAGVKALVRRPVHLVILDMTLPIDDLESSPIGTEFLTFGGEMVLREIKRRRIHTKVVGLTQYRSFVRKNVEVSFEDLRSEILEAYATYVVGFLRFDRASDVWKSELKELIQHENSNCR